VDSILQTNGIDKRADHLLQQRLHLWVRKLALLTAELDPIVQQVTDEQKAQMVIKKAVLDKVVPKHIDSSDNSGTTASSVAVTLDPNVLTVTGAVALTSFISRHKADFARIALSTIDDQRINYITQIVLSQFKTTIAQYWATSNIGNKETDMTALITQWMDRMLTLIFGFPGEFEHIIQLPPAQQSTQHQDLFLSNLLTVFLIHTFSQPDVFADIVSMSKSDLVNVGSDGSANLYASASDDGAGLPIPKHELDRRAAEAAAARAASKAQESACLII
jgi:hypothetical protein